MNQFVHLFFILAVISQWHCRNIEKKSTVREMRVSAAAECCSRRYGPASPRCTLACTETFDKQFGRRAVDYRKYKKILNDQCGRRGYDQQLDACLAGEKQLMRDVKSTTEIVNIIERENQLSFFRSMIKIFGIEWRWLIENRAAEAI